MPTAGHELRDRRTNWEKYTQFISVEFIQGEPCQVLFAPYRCQAAVSTSYVSLDEESEDDDELWGCGEGGSIWYDLANLFSETDQVVPQFKYRKKCYGKLQKKWFAVPCESKAENCEDKFAEEPVDALEEHIRGQPTSQTPLRNDWLRLARMF